MPEKANSVVWIRDGEDSLALGNITGAMVFQSMVPVAVGIAFTDWTFDRFAGLAAVLALVAASSTFGRFTWAERLRATLERRLLRSRLRRRSICDRVPPVAPALPHKRSTRRRLF